MRLLLLLFFTSAVLAAFAKGPADKDTLIVGTDTFSITVITKEIYDKIEVPEDCPEDLGKRVHEYKDSLCLLLKNGRRLTFKNDKAPENDLGYDGEQYYFECEFKEAGQWLIGHSSFENYNYLLVDEKDGSVTELSGFSCRPVISPDKKQLVCGSDCGNIVGVNSIYFFCTENKKVVELGHRILPHWGFSDLKWIDDRTLAAQVFDGSRMSYIRLSLPHK